MSVAGGAGASGATDGFAGAYAIVFEPVGLDQDELTRSGSQRGRWRL